MFYTPKFCCNCSDEIERTKRKLFSSGKFCELCETNFRVQEWFPRLVVIFGMIFGFVGLFGYFQSGDKPLKMSAGAVVGNAVPTNKTLSNQAAVERSLVSAPANSAALNPNNAVNRVAEKNSNSALLIQNTQPKSAGNQPNVAETVYFCGAETKKGMPCSRRVKGGGRCWQHEGQAAMLPNAKLIAGQ